MSPRAGLDGRKTSSHGDSNPGPSSPSGPSPMTVLLFIYHSASVVAIATGYGLDGPELEPLWGQVFFLFSTPFHTGPGNHSSYCTMNTGAFCRRSNVWGVDLTTHPDLATKLKKEYTRTSAPSLSLRGLLRVTRSFIALLSRRKRESAGLFSLTNWLNLSLENLLHALETTGRGMTTIN